MYGRPPRSDEDKRRAFLFYLARPVTDRAIRRDRIQEIWRTYGNSGHQTSARADAQYLVVAFTVLALAVTFSFLVGTADTEERCLRSSGIFVFLGADWEDDEYPGTREGGPDGWYTVFEIRILRRRAGFLRTVFCWRWMHSASLIRFLVLVWDSF